MNKALARRKSKMRTLVPVAAMADIAFLLIIFFILTTNFMTESHIELEEASSRDIEILEQSTVSVSLDKEGNLWLQGEPCPQEVLESGVAALLQDREQKTVMLKIDRELPHEKYGPVFLALSGAGAEIALVGAKTDGAE